MADQMLKPITALGGDLPKTIEIGIYRISERFDVALASVASRRDREGDVAKAAKKAKLPLPEASHAESGVPYGAFWLSSQLWMVEAPFASHEDIATHLRAVFGDAASITEQTDAWVRFDVSSANPQPLFEKLCNVDLAAAPVGYAGRTVIEHSGCYVIKRKATEITIYGSRSMAASLFHAIEVTALSLK